MELIKQLGGGSQAVNDKLRQMKDAEKRLSIKAKKEKLQDGSIG